jgi:two-component system alkaline phosphatase synthesis response regulator PhoP
MPLEKRILIVDDDATIRALIGTVLRKRGWTSDVARDGLEALERMDRWRYTLVILDLMMPRMSGYELLEKIGELPLISRPLVLVLTAGTTSGPFDSNIVSGLVPKPFDVELLLDTVRGCLAAVEGVAQSDTCAAPPNLTMRVSDDAN